MRHMGRHIKEETRSEQNQRSSDKGVMWCRTSATALNDKIKMIEHKNRQSKREMRSNATKKVCKISKMNKIQVG